jgi:Putative peptidoglycan binding domain
VARRAKANETLLAQVDALAPTRDKSSDGWIASDEHHKQNPKSDHEANAKGHVLAQDITHDPRDGLDSYKLAEALRSAKDIRTGYVISNRKIFGGPKSPTYGKDPWKWKPYSGTNPHDEHVHHSLAHDETLYDDPRAWDLSGFHAIPNPMAPKKTFPVLRKGAKGFYVSLLQTCLGGSIVDGDFGQMTEQAVLQFQRDHQLDADGVVGVYTWRELLRPWAKEVNLLPLDPRAKLTEMAVLAQKTGSTASTDELLAGFLTIISDLLPPGFTVKPEPEPPSDQDLDEQIMELAANSEIARYRWGGNRGVAPLGYTKGMALAFANTLTRYRQGDSSAVLMASADTYNDTKDALSWYRSNFKAKGMSNETAGADTLRHLYVLLMGLGIRESSGRHCCGIDTSAGASSRKSDTCEAGAWQQSWNSHTASGEIDKLFDEYKNDPSGCLQSVFAEGVSCTAAEWKVWGTGQGAEFQKLAKDCPMFAVESAGVCLRVLRKHFGPINRKEAEIVTAADTMFMDVQRLVEGELAVAA